MGSRGSGFDGTNEFGVSGAIISTIHNSEPEDTAVSIIRDLDVGFEGEWTPPEPEVGYGGSSEATNADQAFLFIPYEHYMIDGDDYFRVELDGKEYIFDGESWEDFAEKFAKDHGVTNFELDDDYYETMQDALNHAQEVADKEYAEMLEDPWNWIDDSQYDLSHEW